MKKLFMILLLGMFMLSFSSAGLFDPGSEVAFHEEGKNGKWGYYEINETDFWFFNNKPVKTIELIENDYSVYTAWNVKEIEVFKPTKLFDKTNYLDKEQKEDKSNLLSSELHLYREWKTKTRIISSFECLSYETVINGTNSSQVCMEQKINSYEEEYVDWDEWEVYNFGVVQEGLYQTKTIVTRDSQGTGIIDWVDENEGYDLNEWETWWDSSWNYKREISNLTGNFSALFSINWDSNMQTDFDDLRFLDNATESIELNYTIEKYTASTSAVIRVFNQGASSIKMYYGNPSISTTESASDTYFEPVSAYYFDDNANDFVGGNNGTVDGADLVDGYINRSYDFTHADDDKIVMNNSVISTTGDFSYNIWAKLDDLGVDTMFLGNGDNVDGAYLSHSGTNDAVYLNFRVATTNHLVSKAQFPGGSWNTAKWYMLTVISSSSTSKIYVDAVSVHSSATGSKVSASNNFSIGRGYTTDDTPEGKLDEVLIYDSELTQDQITALYTQTAPNFIEGAEEQNSGITTTLISPANALQTTDTQINFTFQSSPNNVNLTNATLNIWNATGNALLISNFTTLSGNESINTTFINNLTEGNYLWGAVTEGTSGTSDTSTNRTLTIHFTAPIVNITAPSGTSNYFIDGDNEVLVYNISEPGQNISEHLVDCWFFYGKETDLLNQSEIPTPYLEANYSFSYDNSTGNEGLLITRQTDFSLGLPVTEYFNLENCSTSLINATSYCSGLLTYECDNNFTCGAELIASVPTSANAIFQQKDILSIVQFNGNYNESINCSGNTTNFTYVNGVNNITVYAEDDLGLIGSDTSVWDYHVLEINQTFDAIVTEGTTAGFQIVVETSTQIASANLIYDGTSFVGTLTQNDLTSYIVDADIVIPSVAADVNKTFFWQIILSDANATNTTETNQTVLNIEVDDCSSGTTLIMNYSLFQEESQAVLNGTIEVDLQLVSSDGSTIISSFSNDYVNVTSAPVCLNNISGVSINYLIDSVASYTATGFAEEFHNIQMGVLDNSTIPINISLFALDEDDSTTFLITYKGIDFLPLIGALFNVQRQYISEGVFKSVEIVASDDEGFQKAHFDTEGVIYRITITKDGEVIDSFDNVKVLCDNVITEDCQINLNSFSSQTDFTTWQQFGDITFESNFDSSTRTKTVSFNTVDGTPANVTISGYTSDGSSTELCSSSLVSSAGVIQCIVPERFGNLTIVSVLSTADVIVLSELDVISSNPIDAFGVDAYVFAFILVISFPLMLVGSPIGVMFGLIFGVLASFMLLLADNSGLLGPTAAFTWLLVAAAILVYKMFRRDR